MSRIQSHEPESEIDLREELFKYVRHWPWFLLCTLAALGSAVFVLQVITPRYSSASTILIKDEESPKTELAAFSEIGLLGGITTNNVENEIGVLRSYRLMENVVQDLQLHVRYFEPGSLRDREIYTSTPVKAEILHLDLYALEQLTEPGTRSFQVDHQSNNIFRLTRLSDGKTYTAPMMDSVELGFGSVLLHRNLDLSSNRLEEGPVIIKFLHPEEVADHYQEILSVNLKEKNSSLVALELEDPVVQRGEDILDQLVQVYNQEAIEDKNILARNTAEFIHERLNIINAELEQIETGKANFKEEHRLADLQAQSQLLLTSASNYTQRHQELTTQLELVNAILDFIKENSPSELLPTNLGLEGKSVNEEILRFNELVLERNRILAGSTVRNPVVITLSDRIKELKENIYKGLLRLQSNLEITTQNLEDQRQEISSEIAAVPAEEKLYRGIERQQQIKETLYLFLLEKREENALSLAATAPKAKVVDPARSSGIPISPKPKIVYLAAILLGLLLPFLVIYIRNLLNNKVRNREDIEGLVPGIPIVGEIPKISTSSELVKQHDRSILAESFRILYHNFKYLLLRVKEKNSGISILVTSSIKGEGKTFTAFNLAMTLANSGQRVVVVGADLRNPQMKRFLPEFKDYQGVSDYLINPGQHLQDLLLKSPLHKDLHILPSGNIPPNPSELLDQESLPSMIQELEKKYDYVILDTAPTMPVVDTFLFTEFVDLTLFVVRAGHTEKKLLEFVVQAKKEQKFGDMGIILNNVSAVNLGYGNRYGYAYGEKERTVWKQIRKVASIF